MNMRVRKLHRRADASRIARQGRAAALTIGSSISVSPICGALFLLLAAGATRAEGLSGDKGSTTYAIAMHGQPALSADFSRLPYADPQAVKGGRLVLAYQGTFDSLNPYNVSAGTTAQGLIGNIFQSLMLRSLDEPFTLYGLIARSIETDDARSYVIFHLDPRARFSDGVPVTAADVLFTFDLLKKKGRPQQRDALGRVKRAEALDLMTVRFDLSGLDREMPLTLATMPVLPKHRTDVELFDTPTLKPPVGTGPYVIADVQPGERLLLRRNPDYWAKDLPVQRGLFNFDEIEIDYYRDADSSFEAFKAGLYNFRQETDPGRWISSYDFPAVRDGRIVKESLPYGLPKGMEGFAFNTRRSIFADIRVREALDLMFDFEWINANLYGGLYRRSRSFFDDSELASAGRPADTGERALLAPFPGVVRDDILEGRWEPPVTDGSGRDRTMARRALALLGEAGYAIKDGALVERASGRPFAFEILVQSSPQERLSLIYADSLRRIGIDVTVRLVDELQYQRRRQKFDFDMLIAAWIASPSPGYEQRFLWGSRSADQEGSYNLTGARSPVIDAMIAAMVAAKTHEEFVDAVRAYDRVLLSGFYIVPLFYTREQWIAYSDKLARPKYIPLFGVTIDNWWQKRP
jgi:peptide/nickel transport system substrate-binding protein